MHDVNPLRSTMDPNDAAYVMGCTSHLFGALDGPARKALAQVKAGRISYRFAMIALGRLAHQHYRARRRRLGLE